MVKITKKCEYVMPDGYRCNRPFTVSSAVGRVVNCEDHRATRSKDGLSRSTNIHAQSGNDKRMREWVMEKIRNEHADKARIEKLENEVARLTKLVGDVQGRKEVLQTEVRDVIKELDPFASNNPEIIRLNDRLLKIHNRSIKVDKRTEGLLDDWEKMVAIGTFKKATADTIMQNKKEIRRLFTMLGLCSICGQAHQSRYCPNRDLEEE